MPSWPIERWISPSISPARVSCHVYSGHRAEPAHRRARGRHARRRRCRVPFSAPLEDAYLPGVEEIVAAVRGLR